VSAIGVRHVDGAHENMAYMTLRYDHGPLIAHFHLNWLAPVKVRVAMIGGTRKMLVYDDMEAAEKLKIYDKGVDVRDQGPAPVDIEARRRTLISYRSGDLWSPRLDSTEALAVAARDFAGAIRGHRPPVCDGELGLDVVRTLAAGQASLAANGAFVAV
jgi:predicted dehydrogenase